MSTVSAGIHDTYRHRTVHASLTVTEADGTPLPHQDVTVRQTRHAFGFGNIGFDFLPLANEETQALPDSPFGGAAVEQGAHLAALWFDVFNTATLPFYWRGFEQHRGRPDTRRLLRTARWFVERGAEVKGHPLVWHTLAPGWLLDLSVDQVRAAVTGRIRREVCDFAGVVRVWDAINEAVIMPVFTQEENGITRLAQQLGRVAMVRLAFDTVREAAPSVRLVLNDFDLSPAYERLVEECLDAGVRIDALGLQSHMHQGYWGEERTEEVLARFSRFGLPLQLTETTLLSGHLMPPQIEDLNDYRVPHWPSTPEGEERQADEIVRHYTTLVRHPQVESITYWGLTDDGAWLGAPAGLVRADGTPKPAYDALRRLVRDTWWLGETATRTDGEGRVDVVGFAGTYEVRVAGRTATVRLETPGRTHGVVRPA
jgi:endo-1,4-beta-xylanase